MGRSDFGTEEVDTAETRHEADYMLGEYRLAFGPGWVLWIEGDGPEPGSRVADVAWHSYLVQRAAGLDRGEV
jgi:hypothetical protein